MLRLEQALAQIVREADDANCDAEVLEGTGRPGSCVRLERRCGQRVAQAQDQLRPRVDSGGYPCQLEGIGQHLVPLRALGRSLVRPALGQDRPARVGTIDLDALPDGTVMVAGFSSEPSCAPSRSSITRSAPRCSAESPAGTAPAFWTVPALARAPVTGKASLTCPGLLPGSRSWSWSPSHSLTILPSGPGRRRTIPARSSARQIWFTVCRGDMAARGDLVVIEGLRADPDSCHDALSVAAGGHARSMLQRQATCLGCAELP